MGSLGSPAGKVQRLNLTLCRSYIPTQTLLLLFPILPFRILDLLSFLCLGLCLSVSLACSLALRLTQFLGIMARGYAQKASCAASHKQR